MNPVNTHKCDVFVIGSSLEGCIAAVESAKNGKKVLLAENNGSLGQASTNGLNVYMKKTDNLSGKVGEYIDFFLKEAGNAEKSSLYHDQDLKLVIQHLLDDHGVQVLTHVFSSEAIFQDNKLRGFQIGTKTGYIDVLAEKIIDASDKMEAATIAGLESAIKSGKVKTAVKFNQVSTDAIRKFSDEVCEDNDIHLVGKKSLELSKEYGNMMLLSSDLNLYHDTSLNQLIITGLTAKLKKNSVKDFSEAQSRLRMFAYEFRNYLRREIEGFEKAHIIHVAPRLEGYGFRRIVSNPYSNLILLNNNVKRYGNIKAISLGIEAGNR